METKETKEEAVKRLDKLFTLEEKLDALNELEENGYDYELVANKFGIKVELLTTWAKRMLPDINPKADMVSSVMISSDDEIDTKFVRTAKELRLIMLEQMRTLMVKETNLDKITKAIEALHKISTSKDPWFGENKPAANNFYQQVTNVILSAKSYEKKINNPD